MSQLISAVLDVGGSCQVLGYFIHSADLAEDSIRCICIDVIPPDIKSDTTDSDSPRRTDCGTPGIREESRALVSLPLMSRSGMTVNREKEYVAVGRLLLLRFSHGDIHTEPPSVVVVTPSRCCGVPTAARVFTYPTTSSLTFALWLTSGLTARDLAPHIIEHIRFHASLLFMSLWTGTAPSATSSEGSQRLSGL